jgi:hypothetical protein
MNLQPYHSSALIILLSVITLAIPACRNTPDEPSYAGSYHLHFSAMRSFTNRFRPEISLKKYGPLHVTVKTDDNGSHIITFPRCRIFLMPDKNSDRARIVPGAHANTCILDAGGKIGEIAISFYNGAAKYGRDRTMRMTLYGTTQPVEDGGPEGTVQFTFSGAAPSRQTR